MGTRPSRKPPSQWGSRWRLSLAKAALAGLGTSALLWGMSISAQEPAPRPIPFWGRFMFMQQPAQPPAPAQPPTPAQPPQAPAQAPATPPSTPDTAPSTAGSSVESIFRSSFTAPAGGGESAGTPAGAGSQGVVSTAQAQALSSTPSTGVVSGAEAVTRATSDTGDLLGKSFGSVGVELQRRNPIVSDPHIRGYHLGEVVTIADGAFWVPARADLDTIVSKTDSANIANILVIKGPYSVRQGPGFAFLDIETLSSPRYSTFEMHGSTTMSYKSNGEAINGRQAIWGGGADYGFRLAYDLMTANDYRTGAGTLMPASYNSQNFSLNFGFDLTENERIELRALHLSQRNIEFPGIVTDLNKAVTDGYTLRFISEKQEWYDRAAFDAYYNDTRFTGDSLRAGKARQIPVLSDFAAGLPNGFKARYSIETNGENHTWGFRDSVTWGEKDQLQLTAGVDFAYQSTAINEFDTFILTTQNFPLPRSYSTDPGIFADTYIPIGERFSIKVGARADVYQSRIQSPPSFPTTTGVNQTDFLLGLLGPNALATQNFGMYAGYATGEYKLSNEVTANLGYGFAQRPPTMTELFAAGMFLGVLQPGLTFVNGDPDLDQEHLHQFDFGVKGNYENVRVAGNVFYAHVFDYITFQRFSQLAVFNGYNYINTAQAYLWGGEMYGEADLTDWMTPFATLAYSRGHDITRNEALPNIYPLEARAGLRIHEPGRTPNWGAEFNARMVQAQNQVAWTLGDPATYGTNELPTAGFTVFDVRGYWSVTKDVLLTAGVENIGNRFYREHLDYRSGGGVFQPGLNAYFGMRVTY